MKKLQKSLNKLVLVFIKDRKESHTFLVDFSFTVLFCFVLSCHETIKMHQHFYNAE